jgi:hypothetical protein
VLLLFQSGGWVEKLSAEANVDEVPDTLDATQRALDTAQGGRESVAQFLMSTMQEGQRLLQDLR